MMNYYTAEYAKENKTFRADTMTEAKDHANIIGHGEKPTCVREATEGEVEGAKAKYAREVAGTYR